MIPHFAHLLKPVLLKAFQNFIDLGLPPDDKDPHGQAYHSQEDCAITEACPALRFLRAG
jgi:hypothetical protein